MWRAALGVDHRSATEQNGQTVWSVFRREEEGRREGGHTEMAEERYLDRAWRPAPTMGPFGGCVILQEVNLHIVYSECYNQ